MSSSFEQRNGFLSYANPNYQRVPSDENCNVEIDGSLDDLYEGLNIACRVNRKTGVSSRRKYANLEPSSMGVDLDLEARPMLSGDPGIDNENSIYDSNENNDVVKRSTFLDYYRSVESASKLALDADASTQSYRSISSKLSDYDDFNYQDLGDCEGLPIGWEKHEDESGPYYWHISSGTIQRDPPLSHSASYKSSTTLLKDIELMCTAKEPGFDSKASAGVRCSTVLNARSQDEKFKRRSCPGNSCNAAADKRPIRFAVRSLGWVEIAEEDLTPERSSKAVNKCIVDSCIGKNDILDVVGRWGDGKDLYMDLDDYSLRLMDTKELTILNTQPIHTIRVWGVGRDNGQNFAYVARDRVTKKYMCHVFRCDIPARIIANTLRDICKKIMIERSLQKTVKKQTEPSKSDLLEHLEKRIPNRPTDLPMENGLFSQTESQGSFSARLFPTPMEEPKKVLKVHYLGSTNVDKATGVEVLNDAIEKLSTAVPKTDYKYVNVAVAPSTITVSEPGEENNLVAECRVRFLSFLGIGKNVKMCGFIVHTAKDDFVAHVFYCEPSSGALCKTIEAACKLRYQKCLDAHRQNSNINASDVKRKDIKAALKNVFGTFFPNRLRRSAEVGT